MEVHVLDNFANAKSSRGTDKAAKPLFCLSARPAMSTRTALPEIVDQTTGWPFDVLQCLLPIWGPDMPDSLPRSCHSSFIRHDNGKTSVQPHTSNGYRSYLPSSPFHVPWSIALIHGNKSIDCHPSAISEGLPSPLMILFLGLRKTYRLRTRDHFGPVIMKYFLSSLGLG